MGDLSILSSKKFCLAGQRIGGAQVSQEECQLNISFTGVESLGFDTNSVRDCLQPTRGQAIHHDAPTQLKSGPRAHADVAVYSTISTHYIDHDRTGSHYRERKIECDNSVVFTITTPVIHT